MKFTGQKKLTESGGLDSHHAPLDLKTIVQRVHPEDRKNVESTLGERRAFHRDYRIVLPDGTVKYIHSVGHPVCSASGELVQMAGTVVDVTERKLAEQERERLRRLEAEIGHTNRVSVMGELTASLAHEIKQPITAAVSNAEACLQWLAHGQPDLVEVREAATAMVKEARRAAEIITRVRSTALRFPSTFSRASYLAMRKGLSPAPSHKGSADSKWPTREHFSWTKWAICRFLCSLNC